MLDVLNKCFADKMKSEDWKNKLSEMIPSYGKSIIDDAELCRKTRKATAKVLGLDK